MIPIEAYMIGAIGLALVVLGTAVSDNTNYGLVLLFLGGILIAAAIEWGR